MSDHVKALERWINASREGEEYRVAIAIRAVLEEHEKYRLGMQENCVLRKENGRLRAEVYGPEPEQPKMTSGTCTASENAEPFKDNPILQARRRAFDHPTQANLCNLTDVVHREVSQGFHERLRAITTRADKYKARIDAALALHISDEAENCIECSYQLDSFVSWPCPTVKALRGDQPERHGPLLSVQDQLDRDLDDLEKP